MPDYYAILEVSPTATQGEIKRSYRRLARKYHPDLNRQAHDKHIKLLNEAYKVLNNPLKRAAYDRQRLEEEQERERLREKQRAMQEALRRKREQARAEPKMTWVEGIIGFVRELRRELRDEA